MLSSQAVPILRISTSPINLQTSIYPSIAIPRSGGARSRISRPLNQTRTFRLGVWSSYLDSSLQKEIHRRHRIVKHKYIEALNRKLSWDHQHQGYARPKGLKSFMCNAWTKHDSRAGRRWLDMDELKAVKDEPQTSNSRGIEDVEQNALDKLLANNDGTYEYVYTGSRVFGRGWNSTLFMSKNTFKSPTPTYSAPLPKNDAPSRTTYGDERFGRKFQRPLDSDSHPEYAIDPITNRKVFKKTPSHDSESTRNASNIPVKTFKGYKSQFQDFAPPTTKPLEEELKSYQPFLYNEPDGNLPQRPNPEKESLNGFPGEVYSPFFYNEPDGKLPETPNPVEEALRDYDCRTSYEPFQHNEPDGKVPPKTDPVQEGLKDYDNAASYEQFLFNEPDGKCHKSPDPVQESLKDYDNTTSYEPFLFNEPDGKSPEKLDSVQESLKDYDASTSYTPFLYREPDGKLPDKPDPVQQGLRDFDEKQAPIIQAAREGYKPFKFNELDGPLLPEREMNAQNGSGKYSFRRIFNNITNRGYDFEESTRLPVLSNKTAEDNPNLEDQQTSNAVAAATEKGKEIPTLAEDLRIEHSELQNHAAHARSRVNAKIAEVEAGWSERSPQTNVQESLTGDSPETRDATWTTEKSTAENLAQHKTKTDPWGYDQTPKGLEVSYQEEVENEIQKAENEYIQGLASQESFARNSETPRIQTSLDRSSFQIVEEESGENSTGIQDEIDPYSKEPQGLETCYIEECAQKRDEDRAPFSSSYGTLKTDEDGTKEDYVPIQRSGTSREQKDEGLVRECREIYEETYGTIDNQHRQIPETVIASQQMDGSDITERDMKIDALDAQEPTVYKILAYDPTMQSISTAEATSIVADSSIALTPAEVLLRLSNPAKFFPHFEILQAQGYEIVSGSGDVLVFRKVRPAAPPAAGTAASSVQDRTRKATNPIDGMQSRLVAATGNFASPTGFVNHDFPGDSNPPFKSNIDVRREEDVFSGKSTWTEDSESPRRKSSGTGKRLLIGAAWVGACSYAVGVIAEFFKTGGIDGKGPQGF